MKYLIKQVAGLGVLLCLMAGTATAQPKKNARPAEPKHLKAAMIAKGYEDSVVIRWAPASPEAWIMGNETGYQLTRVDISQPGHPVKTTMGASLFQPMPEKQLLAGLDTTDEKTKYLTVAEKMLYGKQYSTSRTTPKSFMQQAKNQHGALVLRYAMALMAADYYPPAADVLGLRYVDRQVRQGGKYVYLLTSSLSNKNYIMDSASVFVINVKAKKEPVPKGLEAYGYDRKIEIRWNRRQDGYFSGYYLERSDDGGTTYHPLTRTPYNSTYIPPTGDKKKDSLLSHGKNDVLRDQQIYEDSIARDYKLYYYRLRAVNGFGELSSYATPVAIQGRDLTPPIAPLIDSAKNIAGNQVTIWWKQRTTSPDLAGYYIDRGTSAKGPFYALSGKMLDKQATTFTDTAALSHQANYYVVIAVDTAKNVSSSAPALAYLTDTIPPAAPIGVTGTVDSTGVVQLQWKSNLEPDLLGYQVYSSFNPDYEFSQITHALVTDNHFIDTVSMNSLDRRVYYKVVALDKSYNHSSFSATAQLKKPILIPPSAPVAGKIGVSKKRVDIEWIESRSEGAAAYQVYRKEQGKDWSPLAKLKQDWSVSALHFTDSAMAVNTDYYYAAETIDSSGIRSARSFAVHVRSHAVDTLPALNNLQAKLNSGQHSIQLNWQYKDTGDYFFVVYRSVNNGTLDAWHSFDKTVRTGTDDQVKSGVYGYAIQVVRRDKNSVSDIGKPVLVKVNND
jgi:fibronectin type 3 domain-containing protein